MSDGWWTADGRWQRATDTLTRPIWPSKSQDGKRRHPHREQWTEAERACKRKDELFGILVRNIERLFWTTVTILLVHFGFGPPPG